MVRALPNYRVRSAESHVAFLEREIDKLRHQVTTDVIEIVPEVNDALDRHSRLQRAVEAAYCDGAEYDEALDDQLTDLFRRWDALATTLNELAAGVECEGQPIPGMARLRDGLAEVKGLLNPSDEVTDWMSDLRGRAEAEFKAGHTVDGLVD